MPVHDLSPVGAPCWIDLFTSDTDGARAFYAELFGWSRGSTIVPAMAVADLGTMAVVTDSSQAAIGMWQPGTHRGFGVVAEPGAPSWFELHTRDYDAALSYYRDVFGWDIHVMSDTPEFHYSTNGEGDAAVAGVIDASGFLPDGVPSNWQIYFGVADADATSASIVSRGGSIVTAAEDTPFGRLATVTDPTGAMFRLVQAPT